MVHGYKTASRERCVPVKQTTLIKKEEPLLSVIPAGASSQIKSAVLTLAWLK